MAVRGLTDSGDYALVTDTAAHDIVGDYFSAACWFRPNVLDANGRGLIGKWDASDNVGSAYLLYINSNVLNFLIRGASAQDIVASTTVLTINRWYHTVAVKTPTGIAMYIDGKLDCVAASLNSIQNSAKSLFLMIYANATVNLNGAVADVALWDVSLNPDEAYKLSRGTRAKYIRPGSLRGYWPLYKAVGASQLLTDESKYANHFVTDSVSDLNSFQDPPQLNDPTTQILSDVVTKIKKPGSVVRASIYRAITARRPTVSRARSFVGTSNSSLMYIGTPPTELQLSGADYATMMIWIRPQSGGINGSTGQLMCHSNGAGTQWDCYHQSGHVEWRVGGTGSETCTGVTDLFSAANIEHWHHVAIRKNGQSASAMQTFINGKLDASATSSRTFPGGANDFCIANRGQIDSAIAARFADYAIWDAALTNEEITRIYMGANPLYIRPGNLKGYWPLDDTERIGGLDVSRDRGRYNNHMTVWSGSPVIPVIQATRELAGESMDVPIFGGESDLGAIALTQVIVGN